MTTFARTGPIFADVNLQRPLKPACVGQGLTAVCAKAGRARVKKATADAPVAVSVATVFFMFIFNLYSS